MDSSINCSASLFRGRWRLFHHPLISRTWSRETRPNKSLDAGGGSVFLNMIGPAMLSEFAPPRQLNRYVSIFLGRIPYGKSRISIDQVLTHHYWKYTSSW